MRRMHAIKLCGLMMLGLALGIGGASAQDKTFELKLSHWVPPTHPLQKAIEEWGADIEKASGGTIKYKCSRRSSSASGRNRPSRCTRNGLIAYARLAAIPTRS